MKIVFFFSLLSVSAVAGTLTCNFGDPFLKGTLNRKSLNVAYVGESRDEITSGKDINNNPVKQESSRNGRTKFTIDAISEDGDYGTVYTLYLPKSLKAGKLDASLSIQHFSRGPSGSSYFDGICTLK